MKECPQCNVTIETNHAACPLCGGELRTTDGSFEQDFPPVRSASPRVRVLLRLTLLITIAVVAACILFDTLHETQVFWSVGVVAGAGYLWLSVLTAMRSSKNVGLMILIQLLGISGLAVVANYITGGTRWAIDYIIPLLLVLSTVVITSITLLRPMQLRDYIVYLIDVAVLSLVSLLLIALNIATVRWALLSAASYSIVTLLGMFLFADRRARHEMKKRFHL